MPVYEVTDPASGRIVELTGDTPPTDADLDEIFSSLPPVKKEKAESQKEDLVKKYADRKMEPTALDVGATILSGAVMEPVAGLAGLVATPFVGAEQGAEIVKNVRDSAYTPKTESGKEVINAIGNVAGYPLRKADEVLGNVGEKIAGPAGRTIGENITTPILEILGFKGTRAAKHAALKAEIEKNPSALTPEVQEVLKEQGFDDVSRLDPQQAERAARASQFDAKLTQGELTKDFATQKAEQALLESATDSSGELMRVGKRDQSTAIRSSVDKTIDSLGIPAEMATSVKDAIANRKRMLKNTRREAYGKLSQAAEGQNIPVIPNNLMKDFPDKGTVRTIAATNPGTHKAFSDLLVEFGIDADPAAVERMTNSGIEITPLTLANQEAFRRRLGVISKSDATGQMEVLTGPIRKNLDEEIDLMSQTLEKSGNPNVAEFAKQARQSNIALKTEFDPKSITDRLISKKTNSVLPTIEESRVYQTIASDSLPVEEVSRLMDSLEASGSKKAVGDVQSAMMLDLIDSAYSASTRKIDGVPVFGGPAFQKRFKQLEPKLDVIYRTNPQALERLKALNELAKDLTPPSGAVPKGSASFLYDLWGRTFNQFIKIPIAGGMLNGIDDLAQKAKNRKVLNNAMKSKPELRQTANVIATDYPGLAAALGIGYLSQEQESSSSSESRNR